LPQKINQAKAPLEKEISSLAEERKNLLSENKDKDLNILSLTKERDDLAKNLALMKEKEQSLSTELASLGTNLKDTQAELPQKINQAKAPLEKEISSLAEERKNLLSENNAKDLVIKTLNMDRENYDKNLMQAKIKESSLLDKLVLLEKELKQTQIEKIYGYS
jgi:chromosome segregation ATPase